MVVNGVERLAFAQAQGPRVMDVQEVPEALQGCNLRQLDDYFAQMDAAAQIGDPLTITVVEPLRLRVGYKDESGQKREYAIHSLSLLQWPNGTYVINATDATTEELITLQLLYCDFLYVNGD
jgi:hypothetical protein